MKVTNSDFTNKEPGIDKSRNKKDPVHPIKKDVLNSGDQAITSRIFITERMLTKKHLLLDAFQRIRGWLEENIMDYEERLSELVEKTRLGEEGILEPYRRQLSKILKERDISGLERNITTIAEEIERELPELSRRRTTIQNRLSLLHDLDGDGISHLMKRVVKGIKDSGANPGSRLKRENVIDLLE